jgi:hypothetical protein
MIQEISIINDRNTVKINLFNNRDKSLYISNIDGLGVPKVDISTTTFATQDGEKVSHSKILGRTINMTFLLTDRNSSLEALRQTLYSIFGLKKQVILQIKNSIAIYNIGVYATSIAPDIFSELQSVVVELFAPYPYFQHAAPTTVSLTEKTPLFHFPFSNPVDERTLVFSGISHDPYVFINNISEVPIGFIARITISAADTYKLYNTTTDEEINVDTTRIAPYTLGDILVVSTLSTNKTVYIQRGVSRITGITGISRGSIFPILTMGRNQIGVVDSNGTPIPTTFEYSLVFGGI